MGALRAVYLILVEGAADEVNEAQLDDPTQPRHASKDLGIGAAALTEKEEDNGINDARMDRRTRLESLWLP